MRYHKLLVFIGFFIFGMLYSCSTEIGLARNIQRNKSKVHLLFSFPNNIILSNAKHDLPRGMSANEEMYFYDSIYYSSDFVQYIDDTIFLRKFKENLELYITELGFEYYESADINEFLVSEGKLYLINFKQLELEERWVPIHREEQFDTLIYEEDLWVNGLSMNAWGDVAKVNDTVEIQKQLYFESVLSDQVEGMFFQSQWSGDVEFQYLVDTLRVHQLGSLQSQSAEEFSDRIINHIINKEIRDQLNYQEATSPLYEWYLSPGSGRVLPKMSQTY